MATRDEDRDLTNTSSSTNRDATPDRNPDPITGAPGSHPVGTGVGAAGGGAAGAAIGAAVTGPAAPVGAVVGAVIGAVAGGLAGKGAAEAVNPTAEDEYWRSNYSTRPYHEANYSYDEDYRPAYQYGWSSRSEHTGREFDEVESHLGQKWDEARGSSRLGWDKAKHAARDAWHRLDSPSDRYEAETERNVGTGAGTGASVGDFSSGRQTTGMSAGESLGGASEMTNPSSNLRGSESYPGHTSEAGEFPSSTSTTGRSSGSDLSSGFSGSRTAGYDDRTGGMMGTQIGGDTDVDNWLNNNRSRYSGRNFDDVENDLHRDWDSSHRSGGSTWEKVKDSVRRAWNKV